MLKEHALEAEPIVKAVLDALLRWAPSRGRSGTDLRARLGIVRSQVAMLLQADAMGEPIAQCFDLALDTGINLMEVEHVRSVADSFEPVHVGAIVTKDALIQFALVIQAQILAHMTFRSRGDLERIKDMMNSSFTSLGEGVADRMDAMTWRAIVALHAAVMFYLIETARPLPRMLSFSFNYPMSTLKMAYRLYADASRADELRYENRVIHPAFAIPRGQALSA